jgi:thymidylate synthase
MQKLVINPGKMDIDTFESGDFEIQQYFPHKKIAMQMAV